MHQLEKYRKHLLNRVTVTPQFVDYIENCLSSEQENAHHSFHKIMIHNWPTDDASLFDALAAYFTVTFIPVNCASQGTIITFYTSSLNLVLRITRLDFMFPHHRNMFSVDILFNDKTSTECFDNSITVDDIVTGVVSSRFSAKYELNLSNLCNDPEFIQNKIYFYKVNLLSHFKILMLRMGRDTKALNLSNNNISQIPTDILNFFMKGNIVEINLSNNKIANMQELNKINRKIECIWLEGNPICEELDAITYVKLVAAKFPRLSELDGVKLNEQGMMMPFFKNYVSTPDSTTKMLVDKFLCLYYSHFDSANRTKIDGFYDAGAVITFSTNMTDSEEKDMEMLSTHSRNILHPRKRAHVFFNQKMYEGRHRIKIVLIKFPDTEHDPTSFTVDVLKHDKKSLILIIDGVFRERQNKHLIFRFRRTFIFTIDQKPKLMQYFIKHEMFTISLATKEVAERSFQNPTRGTSPFSLQSPSSQDIQGMSNIFGKLTGLKSEEVEKRLKDNSFDIVRSIKGFLRDLKSDKISDNQFVMEEDFSDTSSLIEDVD